MDVISFPEPRSSVSTDILVLGGELNTRNLTSAYSRGIFPWPIEGWPLPWFCPRTRAILEFGALRIPRSLAKIKRRNPFDFTIDRNFRQVILGCAQAFRPGQEATWIVPEMIHAYCELHREGHAHSVEAWEGNNLVGGLYGVDAGGLFTGESMFHLSANASKLALLYLIEYLEQRGADWLDIQVMTAHMAAFGATEISRSDFLARLACTRNRRLNLFPSTHDHS